VLTGCSGGDENVLSSVELLSEVSAPLTELRLIVAPPAATPNRAQISLLHLDPIAGLDIQTTQTPLTRRNDGRYEAVLTVPVGSVLSYRYLRTSPDEAFEVTSSLEPVQYRILHISGPSTIEETIASWSDGSDQVNHGRILGHVKDLDSGLGVRELLVSAGGRSTFTEADGSFRLEDLPEGIHHLTVLSMDGAYLPTSQGALVAGGSTTPADLTLRPAQPIFVTFQLTVPEPLGPEVIVRIAGNTSTLGNRFSDLQGGTRVSIDHMPVMVQVDPLHYLAVVSMYAGTDLHYKYSLGDGLWNAERNAEGALLTRQVVLPNEDVVVRDEVFAWGDPSAGSVRFTVQVPENTPIGDQISLQLNPSVWFEPLPMWSVAEKTWSYELYGPMNSGEGLNYRYCRNQQCDSADDAATAGALADGRNLSYAGDPVIIDDEVAGWKWLEQTPDPVAVIAEPVQSTTQRIAGIILASNYHPSWRDRLQSISPYLASLGANTIVLPMEWQWEQQNPIPILSLDPSRAPLEGELREIQMRAEEAGLSTVLKVEVDSSTYDLIPWWSGAERTPSWWQLWFEEYQSFALTAAESAADLGVGTVIMGGEWITPALPAGSLPDGEPSNVPVDAPDRWRELIGKMREKYSGRIVFELDATDESPAIPEFMDSVDAIMVRWRVPIATDLLDDVEQMSRLVQPTLDLWLAQTERFNRPLWLNLDYASVQGGAAACPPAPDGSCRSMDEFAAGLDADPDLSVDMLEQAAAINTILLAGHDRPRITGFLVNGFNASAILWDKSTSIYGKPAEGVVQYWFPRLGGE
jgi:hypothetical protein